MASKTFELPSIGPVTVYKRSSSTTIRLSFDRSGAVRVSIPTWLPYQAGLLFASKRSNWIIKNKPDSPELFRQADKIGKAHRLLFSIEPRNKTVQVRVNGNEIVVKYPEHLVVSSSEVQSAAKRGAKKALLKEAEQLLPQRLSALAAQYGFIYSSVTIKQLTAKWGSCDQKKDIILNYYLMQLPWHLIDYVLMHELVHTEHLNHSDSFWQRFETITKNPKNIRKELREYKTTVIGVQNAH